MLLQSKESFVSFPVLRSETYIPQSTEEAMKERYSHPQRDHQEHDGRTLAGKQWPPSRSLLVNKGLRARQSFNFKKVDATQC